MVWYSRTIVAAAAAVVLRVKSSSSSSSSSIFNRKELVYNNIVDICLFWFYFIHPAGLLRFFFFHISFARRGSYPRRHVVYRRQFSNIIHILYLHISIYALITAAKSGSLRARPTGACVHITSLHFAVYTHRSFIIHVIHVQRVYI